MPSQQRQTRQPPLPDLPLIREDLLVEIEQRQREGASPAELNALRREYRALVGE